MFRFFERRGITLVLIKELEDLRTENAALRADNERLDWMEDNIHALHYGLECKVCVRWEDGMEFNGETWRAAIDAARAAPQGGAK